MTAEVAADIPDPAGVRPRWASLKPDQRALAEDLTARAQRLWEGADGDLSLAEAVDLAAVQGGHVAPTGRAGEAS